ncbi:MAG: tetratricopeptide repeat protein, partial [Myxococcaceae bacterium]|nr:tetratricopeptide repeat protein [Myxococcaceae bacterium]
MSLRLFTVLLVVAAAACTKRIPSPTERLDDAVADVADGDARARAWALAGLHTLLSGGSVEAARTQVDTAVQKDPADPYALYGQLLLAQRQAHGDRAVTIALDLIERAPAHPLSAVAARVVLDHATQAIGLDDELLTRVPPLVQRETLADTAHLLRAALAAIAEARGDDGRVATTLAEMGVPTAMTVMGPFSAWHVVSMSTPTSLERDGAIPESFAGPFGALTPRVMRVADGRLSLSGEPATGDVYVFGVDVTVTKRARYVLRTITSMDHVATLDGTVVLTRSSWQRPASSLSARALTLPAGTHRLLVRASKEDQAGHFQLALQRLDGLPAEVTFAPAAGAPPQWNGVSLLEDVEGVMPTAPDVHAALADEASDALARLIATRDGLGRDRDGARAMLDGVAPSLDGPLVRLLRAELDLSDRFLAPKVAAGRAARDVEAALTKDDGLVAARLLSAQLALDDGRQTEALEAVRKARASHTPASAAVLWLEARIELGLGLEAQAVLTAREAQASWKGHCEALGLEYDVARRRDAVAEADALLDRARQCPNAPWRKAEHDKTRGKLEAVVATWRAQLARDDSQVQVASALASALTALSRFDEAASVLEAVAKAWPRSALLLKQLADVHEQAGRANEALAVRERALLLDGSDLPLRRAVERVKTGKELLESYAISTEAALKAYEAAPGAEDATAAFLLDAAAIEAFPDGTQVDRVHIMQKALDQSGVQEVAEVQLPQGAVVLKLRTLKPDGRTLEPESIEGKDAVSLPGVQVGDVVEYEYLLAHPTRGPGQPGFTASNFYFQVAKHPNNWSTYTVIAPKGSGLTVDAHQLGPVAKVKVEGEKEVFTHEEKRVPPYIPEPVGPPSGTEWLPFVSVGAGQRGNEGVITAYADAFLDRGAITHEVERFAKDAKGLEAVRAVYAAVMKKLSGRDAGLSMSAAASVGQDRGSRTWLLQAALTALGFDARLVAVRAFSADPAPYLFPNESLYPYVCVRVLVDGKPVWLDALVRFAPFGELPEFAMGEREAWVLPRPGEVPERTTTPPRTTQPSKTVVLTASLDEDGVLKGEGVETYAGYDAAQLAEALEQLSPEQRKQALEQALSRMFGGADLEQVDVEAPREVGASVKVSYRFSASRFARREGNTLVLGALTFPWNLGRRYLVLGQRVTPLFIESSESTVSKVTLTVPEGYRLKDGGSDLKTSCDWGRFVRRESQAGRVIT